ASGATYTDFLTAYQLPALTLDQLPIEALAAATLYELYHFDMPVPSPLLTGDADHRADAAPGHRQGAGWRLHGAGMPLRYRWGEQQHSVLASRQRQGWALAIAGRRYDARLYAARPDEVVFTLWAGDQPGQRLLRCRIAPDSASGDLWLGLEGL